MGNCASECARECQGQEEQSEFKITTHNQLAVESAVKATTVKAAVAKDLRIRFKSIVRVQSWWRGHLDRKKVGLLRSRQQGSSKYFSEFEGKETVSQKAYSNARKLRGPYKFKSGAVY